MMVLTTFKIPWNGSEAYGKNLTVQMGRCPVRSVSEAALEVLKKNQHLLGYVCASFCEELLRKHAWLTSVWLMKHRFMTDNIMPLSRAAEAYELFNAMKVQKVIFEADK
jgi:threonine dehydrogenase-like Zn-dependent dehydrogenase